MAASAYVHSRGADALTKVVQPLSGAARDYDLLMSFIGNSKYVLLGEASHGTHEFYKARTEISKRLIREKGFNVIAWEADWPDALRVNRFIQNRGQDAAALEALSAFRRFPQWMWRNADILDFIGWLRAHNDPIKDIKRKVGLFGLDLYSLHASIEAVISYLMKVDPASAEKARRRYACFEHFGDDPQTYGLVAGADASTSCEDEVVEQLREMNRKTSELLQVDGKLASDELFFAKQNAVVAIHAENYYRALYRGRPNTWNLRDQHMAETLERLTEHFEKQDHEMKVIIWAHNSHLGDARATTMHQRGELNLGQLVRERHENDCFILGFTTYSGTVTAASDWDLPAERKRVRDALEDSCEEMFHDTGLSAFLLPIRDVTHFPKELNWDLLQRAIGVVYKPETERLSHYFYARIAKQFDAVLHFDKTRAVEPLERTSEWQSTEDLPETYPFAV
jgi:erythromycin esterase-like protein